MSGKKGIGASFAGFWRQLAEKPGRKVLGEKSEYCAWAETINPLRGLTEQRARDIFDDARRGIYADLTYLYAEIEAADPTLLTCTERRESVVGASDWKVAACNPERVRGFDQMLADEQVAFLYEAYGRAGDRLGELAEHLERGFFRGFAHARPVWAERGLGVEGFELFDPWNFAYDRHAGQWWWNPDASALYSDNMSPVPRGELVSVVRQRHIDYPALLIFVRAALGEKKYGVWLERYGIPPVTVTMPPEAAKGDEEAYFTAAQNLAAAGFGALPHGAAVSYATEARGVNPFEEFLRHQQELVVLMATGGTLTSLASPTGIGSGASEAQMAVWREIVRRDIRVSGRAINATVTERLLARQFPGRPVLAMFGFDVDPKPTASEAFGDAAVAKTAGYLIDRKQLEDATGYRLVAEPVGPHSDPTQVREAWGGLRNSDSGVASPLQNARKGAGGGSDGLAHETRQNAPDAILDSGQDYKINKIETGADAILRELGQSLAADLRPVAERVAALLALPEGEQAAAAQALLGDLAGLMPDDPQMAAVLEEAVADAFVGELGVGSAGEREVSSKGAASYLTHSRTHALRPPAATSRTHALTPSNLSNAGNPDQPRGKTGPNTTPGSFTAAGGGEASPKAKAKAEAAQFRKDNQARGTENMKAVEGGADSPDFMKSKRLGRIGFYQGNETEGYQHILRNPDPGHQAMLKDNNIPKTLAHGKYYEDTQAGGWVAVHGSNIVVLGKNGSQGVKVISAYQTKGKAAAFARQTAIENREDDQP